MEQEGLSPYHFCANDPANHTDPTGLHGTEPYNPNNTVSNGGDVGGDGDKTITSTGNQGSGNGVPPSSFPNFGGYNVGDTVAAINNAFNSVMTAPAVPPAVAANPTGTSDVSETTQDLATITPPPPSSPSPTIGDFVAANTGTFGTVISNAVSNAASEVSSAVSSIVNYRPGGFAGVVQDKLNSALIPANNVFNPGAMLANGISGLTTGRDIQTGETLSKASATADIGFALMPGMGEFGSEIESVVEGGIESVQKSFFDGTTYSSKVLGQMQKGDFHAFPESVKAFESSGVISTFKGGDGVTRQMLQIPGSYMGKDGNFEFIKEADGFINHRLFKAQ